MIKPTADSSLPAALVDDWNERLGRVPAAVAAAVRQAVRDHKAAGNPVAVWRDGRVVWLAPHEIPDLPVASQPPG